MLANIGEHLGPLLEESDLVTALARFVLGIGRLDAGVHCDGDLIRLRARLNWVD